MNVVTAIVGSAIAFVGACAAWDIFHVVTTKEAAFEEAKRLTNGKGIINIGTGPHRMFGAQVVARDPEIISMGFSSFTKTWWCITDGKGQKKK